MALDPKRTVAELKELRELTGRRDGAQRVAWTDTWERRASGSATLSRAPAPRRRSTRPATSGSRCRRVGARRSDRRPPRLGAERRLARRRLNVVAGAEVLRRVADDGTPPVTLRLVNWADEEGARFGRSLFGSSAAAGSMADQDELRQLTDADGVALPDAIAAYGVDLDSALDARSELDSRGRVPRAPHRARPRPRVPRPPARRRARHVRGRAPPHHLARPGGARRLDADGPASRRARRGGEARARDSRHRRATGDGAVCTSGGVVCKPGIVTSVVETAEQLLDQRHLDAGSSPRCSPTRRRRASASPPRSPIDVECERIWSIEPILFDDTLLGFCEEAVLEVAGRRTASRLARCTTRRRFRGPASRR